jgi:transcriptional regulator with XRE-family HTH domain
VERVILPDRSRGGPGGAPEGRGLNSFTSKVSSHHPLFEVRSPDMDELAKLKHTLGTGLLRARSRKGYTQSEAASRVGIVTGVYGRIERGNMLPSVPTLFNLCTVLNVSANVLLGFSADVQLVLVPSQESLEEPEDSPEMRRLASTLRTLSPDAIRTMSALASAMSK